MGVSILGLVTSFLALFVTMVLSYYVRKKKPRKRIAIPIMGVIILLLTTSLLGYFRFLGYDFDYIIYPIRIVGMLMMLMIMVSD